MIIWPWTDKQEHVDKLKPDLKVYTIRAYSEGGIWESLNGTLCDCAWTNKKDMRKHHWYKEGNPIELEMTFKEYLILHLREIKGMNFFWTDGREAFVAKWNELHGENVMVFYQGG